MGAYGDHHIDFIKGYPSMYAVDHAAPVADSDIVEGMGIHLNANGQWAKGCPAGVLPWVTGQAQFPTALDVARNSNEMGAKNMGGVALSQGLGFDTTAFTGDPTGKYVSCPTTGNFREANEDEQIVGWCMAVFNDAYGDSVARIIACVMPSIGDGYSSASSESSLSSITESLSTSSTASSETSESSESSETSESSSSPSSESSETSESSSSPSSETSETSESSSSPSSETSESSVTPETESSASSPSSPSSETSESSVTPETESSASSPSSLSSETSESSESSQS